MVCYWISTEGLLSSFLMSNLFRFYATPALIRAYFHMQFTMVRLSKSSRPEKNIARPFSFNADHLPSGGIQCFKSSLQK